MKSIQIIRHAILQVWANLWAAVRTTMPLIVLLALSFGAVDYLLSSSTPGISLNVGSGMLLFAVVGVICITVVYWCIVAWHRYVLLEEEPGRIFPEFHGKLAWKYFGRSLLLGLLLVLIFILPAILLSVLLPVNAIQYPVPQIELLRQPLHVAILLMAFQVVVTFVLLRFSVVLAGTAIGKPIALPDVMTKTMNDKGTIFLVALIWETGSFALWYLQGVIPWGGGIDALIYAWLQFIAGVSLVTTLYGHYIQERPLRA